MYRAKIAVLFTEKINIFLSDAETNKKNRRKRAAFAAAEFSLSGFEAQNDSESDGKSCGGNDLILRREHEGQSVCGNPKQRNRFEQREGNEFVPIHRFDDSAESGLFCAFGTQLKVSVGAFVKRHERWAECQVHHGGGVECAEQFVPELRFCAGQISGFNKACNAERIGFHHERY